MTSSQITSRTNRSITPITSRTTGSSAVSFASTQRRLHRKEFPKFYADLCHLQHSHPLNAVKIYQDRSAVDIQGDRIKFDEWYPIISALSWDQSLHAIAIRLRHRVRVPLESADTDLKARNVTKQPVITTKFVLYWMVEAIKQCLTQSTLLTALELDGLPLRGDYINNLAQALVRTRSLQHLSLYRSSIGDEGAEAICLAVKDLPTLVTLDLSHCELTQLGALALSRLITHQKLCRYSEAWKGTLRYRDPDVDAMPGLRRLTINNNPEIGDHGIQVLTEELRDDLWLRAFDVQDTGLTEEGGGHLLHLIRNNPNLAIVDVRCNVDLPENTLTDIMSLLAINNADKHDSEYKWINRDKEVQKKITTTRSQIRPWGTASIQNTMRSSQKPPSFCSTGPSIKPPLARSHSSLGQKDTRQEQGFAQENMYLKEKLYDLTTALNQEIKQKAQLLKENQELSQRLQRSEERLNELEATKRNVVTEDTLEILEKTLSHLAKLFPKGQGDADSEDESDIPNLLSNINKLLKKGQPEESRSVQCNMRTSRTERRLSRKRHEVNEHVIWEEEEDQTSSGDRCKQRDQLKSKNSSVQKAQEIFAKLLMNGGNKPEKFTHTHKRGKRHVAEKPLTSSGEESSS